MIRKKEKNLKPSQRENKRYFLLDTEKNKEEIEKIILDYIGVLGFAKASPVFVGKILSVNREEVDKIRASFALAGVKIKKVSGTIKGLGK